MQVGQLYVWGLLRWLTPSSSTFQSMESSSWLEWVYTQPMYIANIGGVTGGLPITRPPSFASQDDERRRWLPPLHPLLVHTQPDIPPPPPRYMDVSTKADVRSG